MWKVSESHMTRAKTSDVYMAKMMGDPERAIHNPVNSFSINTFYRQEQKAQEQIHTLDDG